MYVHRFKAAIVDVELLQVLACSYVLWYIFDRVPGHVENLEFDESGEHCRNLCEFVISTAQLCERRAEQVEDAWQLVDFVI
jgi:hypothetical protein